MQHSDFVSLHLHTEYSLLDGAIKIEELIKQAVAYKMPAIAITDHGNICGAVKFYKKAIEAGIKPIIGCEMYVAPNSRFDRSRATIHNGFNREHSGSLTFHLILLARDKDGYKNLTALISKAYLEGFYYKPRIDKDLLQQYSGGLIGLSACMKGEVPYYLGLGNIDKAREVALRYKNILGPENFYLEIQHNGLPEQTDINKLLINLSQELHIPLVATSDSHYLKKEEAKAHDILLCIQTGKNLKDEKRMEMGSNEFYFKSPDEMKQAFHKTPEAIVNTLKIAERCNFEFALNRSLLPAYDMPDGLSPDAYLENLATEGLKRKFKGSPPPDYFERLKMETQVIKKLKFSSYFLIVWDFISYARSNKIPVGPGRGSVAGSLVAYCLDITEIDPIKYNLLFERFLNPDRLSPPDIDVDFCKDRRSEVISYVSEKYGQDHVAQIITFGTMAAKAAIRDVGRVMGIPYAEVDRIAKLVPANNVSIDDAIKLEPQLKDLYDNNPTIRELLDIAKKLEGLSRHASTHAAGVVIAPEQLTDFTAFYKNPSENTIVTQFDMESLESVGLLKFDLLGLKTLTVIQKTIEYMKQQGIEIYPSDIPLNDKEIYRLLSIGETTGIFQLESHGMRDILVKMQSDKFEDIIALVALYRPGPLGSGMIDDFIKRKKSNTEVVYDLPLLKEILDETYGVILYQEQVMRIANRVASFSMGQADILRRAMGKKKPEEMERQKEVFIAGAVKNNIKEKKAERLFELMAFFAEYGFNKSHSAAYAYLACQTAYLKAHYPVEFMAANLSADMGDRDRVVRLINECRHMSIEILPPDINKSEREFKIVGKTIRFGLEAVKGVGSSVVEIILCERQKSPFATFKEFLSRIRHLKVNKKVIESLIKAGAFDTLYMQTGVKDNLNPALARTKAMDEFMSPLMPNSLSLFGGDVDNINPIQKWDEATLLQHEKEALGFYISGHPVTQYRAILSTMGTIQLSEIEGCDERAEVFVAGIINEIKSRARERGVTAYLTIEDETGNSEILVFPELYKITAAEAGILKKGNTVMIKGQVSKGDMGTKIMAKEIQSLHDMEINMKYKVSLQCNNYEDTMKKLREIRKLMNTTQNGKDSVSFKFYFQRHYVVMTSQLQPSNNFVLEVEKIAGEKVEVC